MRVAFRSASFLSMLAIAQPSLPAGANTALDVLGSRIAAAGCTAVAKLEIRNISNPNEPGIDDQYMTTQCGSLTIIRYRANGHRPPLDLLDSMILRQNHRLLPQQLRIGASPKEVIDYAGEPNSRTSGQLVYHLNDEGPGISTATFNFQSNRLQSIHWSWFIE